ncbi:fumarylacetoacetate hydrolase family protein [Sulfitobacter sabulilitoris]|uniref:Fumarylacetoacetate hydrolase family protein n=1 Tax=Sulfitobacter sabulilitoris TaxID=2562655 RepID=A0A5S3PDJ4_9RHOB|nr:fumarylacetoacetate hydrolase family protein [Sulfitobacter sabulilitoris]TMM49566.1 fumarylacetoacetate hydrolase family protein [Sulfitobacter sabulilitoris]
MRLGTVVRDGRQIVVAATRDGLVDLTGACGFADMMAVIDGGGAALDAARAAMAQAPRIDIASAEFRAPLQPAQLRDCLAFEAHLLNAFAQARKLTGRAFDIPPVWYEQPIYYKSNRFSVIGHGQDVIWPGYSRMMDLELELAVVIGKGGRDISEARAPDHIFGYTIFNDMTARDAQMAEMAGQLGPAKGKDFDTGNILGPFILTADEVPHPAALDMRVSVNGTLWGGGNSRDMHHDFARIIAHVSASETLHPGEVIGSGTVGTGCGLELGRYLDDGDRMDLTIEGIGTLSNRIVKRAEVSRQDRDQS